MNLTEGTNVVLIEDLTRYHKSLIKGINGVIVGTASQAHYNEGYNSRFIKVKFPEVTIDILWKNLKTEEKI